jgi:hypothetical protein
MNWQEICDNQSLHNLPFKIELSAAGKILMSPVKVCSVNASHFAELPTADPHGGWGGAGG